MKRCVTILLFILLTVQAEAGDSLSVMFWNLENFFDYTDNGENAGEKEFSATGTRHWTKSRFYGKCNAIAKAILWMEDRYGRLPDAIGFAELENAGVLYSLIHATALKKHDYKVVHYDSDDPRGIDVGFIYRESTFEKISSRPFKVRDHTGHTLRTRDILHVCLKDRRNGQRHHYLVNHHPSKFSGSKATVTSRDYALKTLKHICDSLAALGETHITAMGDFNETPENEAFSIFEGTMTNLAGPLAAKRLGSIRYRGKWDLIDHFIVSEAAGRNGIMEIARIPFLLEWDRSHPGEKPLRTYSGPRYLGGVSDHCPVIFINYSVSVNITQNDIGFSGQNR